MATRLRGASAGTSLGCIKSAEENPPPANEFSASSSRAQANSPATNEFNVAFSSSAPTPH
jgi:hypothetical protein